MSSRRQSSSNGRHPYYPDSKAVFETSEGVKVIPTFDGLNLKEDLLRGIYAYGAKYIFIPLEQIYLLYPTY
jgi:hypothetical protein